MAGGAKSRNAAREGGAAAPAPHMPPVTSQAVAEVAVPVADAVPAADGVPAAFVRGAVHSPEPHDSAHKHVTGAAEYIDDIAEPAGTLHACLGLSDQAHAQISAMDLSHALAVPGVVGALTAQDIAGANDVSALGIGDEPVFATKTASFHGQPLFAIIAETRDAARRAALLGKVEYGELPAIIDVSQALQADARHVFEPMTLQRGNPAQALAAAPRRIKGAMRIGGQEHFYLEGHVALAVPGEDDEITVYSSTQHPSEVQHIVSHVLGVSAHAVVVTVRRMGGGFGGKETQANLFAAVAALAAKKFGRAVKLRPDRDDDMIITGKRHDFLVNYDIGFDDEGRIAAVDAQLAARCGYSADLSGAVTDRALFHSDNAYFYPDLRLASRPLYTHTVSNTAFRGFGGPQGVLVAERIIEEIAANLGMDPLDVRKRNLYGEKGRDLTPYGQKVEHTYLRRIIDTLARESGYRTRRRHIMEANARNPLIVKGIALTPVKFGISFTTTWLNQAAALVHIYSDGSIHLNHGGTEMGQGLFVKVAQIVADCFSLDIDRVRVSATHTGKVPNTSATAASSGSDLNGMAAQNAALELRKRLVEFAAQRWKVRTRQIEFVANHVRIGNLSMPFAELVGEAYRARIHLSAAGFYKTPDISWDRASGKGRPFFYFACGAAVSEVSVDRLTGEYRVDRTDILFDTGNSLNPAIDRGQIEGGFIQGLGWLTCEELWWDAQGRLRTHAPSTYKIPLASDQPRIFNVKMVDWSKNTLRTIRRSKAVGEPPLMLASSVLSALSMAVAGVAGPDGAARAGGAALLDTPATPERVLDAMCRLEEKAVQDHDRD